MAEIPVTKKSGIPWWVWAALAALVLLLLFLFVFNDDDADLAEVEDTAPAVVTTDRPVTRTDTVTRTDADTGVITDLSTIANGTAALDGRQVDIDGVRVVSMAGDRGFTVEAPDGSQGFVVIDEVVPGPDTGDDGEVDVNRGQIVDVRGEVFEVVNGRVNNEPIEGLPPGTQIMIYASEVAIEAR